MAFAAPPVRRVKAAIIRWELRKRLLPQIPGHNLEPSVTGKQAANGEGNIPGVQTGGHAGNGSGVPDMRGILDRDAATAADERTYAEAGTPV